jgi:hypothetical protein
MHAINVKKSVTIFSLTKFRFDERKASMPNTVPKKTAITTIKKIILDEQPISLSDFLAISCMIKIYKMKDSHFEVKRIAPI